MEYFTIRVTWTEDDEQFVDIIHDYGNKDSIAVLIKQIRAWLKKEKPKATDIQFRYDFNKK